MKFLALGDTDGIGASCHFLDLNGSGIALDAGTDPQRDGPDSLPRFDWVGDRADSYVDHTLVTHAHHDHMGSLPVLVRRFPHAMAHMTDATKKLLDILLPASARLQEKRRDRGETTHEPLFTEDELEALHHLYLTHDLGQGFDLTGPKGQSSVTGRFFSAGHILGSAGVELQFEEWGRDRRVFYTSDTNMQAQTIIPGGEYPDSTDVLILESTQGAEPEAAATSRPEERDRFRKTLSQVLARGGTALIPVFVMGRAQEILVLLGQLKREGAIPADVPIYTAGSMRAIAGVYDDTRNTTPRVDASDEVYAVDQERVPYESEAKREILEGPGIMVVSSGMMIEPTLSNVLARRMVENEDDAVLLVGHPAEGTPARRLQDAAAEGDGAPVMLADGHGPQPVYCTVERFRFSGHSDRRELLSLVERMTPETVLLIHGDPDAKDWMAEHIKEAHPETEVHRPDWGSVLEV
ncbi:Cft2 family RNA processing exonuclease [Salinibacter ruber]|jgi:Cft2 family RNA processing exonuclease|uniref:Cft2 family RNA processing exonuclease n=1 Tax=Salinibacter ruber TaxID=146919 RepID=A0A9X2Q6P0_9BACT|nr:MBL fold metallo-hydrolase [Salinibacter ruber]MBB4060133.1 Cft2 family RNA processing exonuclease [Salinibacter ruber]MBB4069940.1 Cft2 family RNA processing exonuclease [Salinibacter ruber]MCS3630324.1 Cft2 family RNA processing exonuclease [Salinibacter ruber]MCS3639999.1 Cft2 family RNA processing exonuclease [Salinibacter ruber]MCS3661366.1 Cft2 family RNA processing exonuclease [Salinibacter ruber]